MCYSNTYTWQKCGHFTIRHEYCEDAEKNDPPTFCVTAHEPIFTDISPNDGLYPDINRHPPAPGQTITPSIWEVRLGRIATSGPGNAWYRDSQGQT
ncbi:unnamed protein product [Zymoseptoria tritici ST99CH_1E4]|uniref:Uncharacterized protein n=1 Tax=Zymoseptoria tritici ST99CH_1E4 TaxID=1276532 RepID=A0A2H1GI16_ZYMTR|nr:unnamed protein product [Zymoseptoria tritici ST99CH_1E4]